MADPLSIVAAATGLAGAAHRIGQAIATLKDKVNGVDQSVEQLQMLVHGLSCVLDALAKELQSPGLVSQPQSLPKPLVDSLPRTISNCDIILVMIDRRIAGLQHPDHRNLVKQTWRAIKLQWKQSEIDEDIRYIKLHTMNLQLSLSIINIHNSTHQYERLDSLEQLMHTRTTLASDHFEKLEQMITVLSERLNAPFQGDDQVPIDDCTRSLVEAARSFISSATPFHGSYSYRTMARSPDFVPRYALQSLIETQLSPNEHCMVVIAGLGGSGKTQLALDYCNRHQTDYVSTFWIDARSTATIERDFGHIFGLLFPLKSPAVIGDVVPWVHAELSTGGPHLMVFDSADAIRDPDDQHFVDIHRFLPRVSGVHILLTTRITEATRLSSLHPVYVKEMSTEEGVALFRKCSKVNDQHEETTKIVNELGHLALAVTLTGCYIAEDPEWPCNLRGFLEEYRKNRSEILDWCPSQLVHQYGESVISTWKFSLDAIERRSAVAARLLTSLSFLDRTGISLDLFRAQTPKAEISREWHTVLTNEADMRTIKKAFVTLTAYSLVNLTGQKYTMHRLVHEWGLQRLDRSELEEFSYQIAHILGNCIENWPTDRQTQQQLVPHLIANAKIIRDTFPLINSERVSLITILSRFDHVIDRAGQLFELTLIRDHVHKSLVSLYGDDHPETIVATTQLANALGRQGKLNEATALREDIVAKRRRLLGDEHPATFQAMSALACTLYDQGKLSEAVAIEVEILAKQRQNLGEEHPDTILAMANLGCTLCDRGDLSDAANLQEQVAAKRQQMLGDQDPDTITAFSNLAQTICEQGKLEQAKHMQQDVYTKRRQVLGDEHPDTISARHNLAIVLHRNDQVDAAAEIREEVLQSFQNTLGEDHPHTVAAMNNLANTLCYLGKRPEATMLREKVLDRRRQIFGSVHPETLVALSNLAISRGQQGALSEAISIHTEVLATRQRILGERHPSTVIARKNLEITQNEQRQAGDSTQSHVQNVALVGSGLNVCIGTDSWVDVYCE